MYVTSTAAGRRHHEEKGFQGNLRDACLSQHLFADLHEAGQLVEKWRRHYNEARPHSSLCYMPPAKFASMAAA